MRYNPDTDRAVYNERVQAESQERFRAGSLAVTAPVAPAPVAPQPAPATPSPEVSWAELEQLQYATGRITGRINKSFVTCCNLSHSMVVAQAMGNFAEYRRLRATLIAQLW